MEVLRGLARVCRPPQEVALSDEFLPSPLHVAARSRDEIARSLLRASFVALTAGLFVVWLASAS